MDIYLNSKGITAEVLPESAMHCSALLCKMAQRTPRKLLIILQIKSALIATNQAVARSNRAGRAIFKNKNSRLESFSSRLFYCLVP